MIIYIICSTLYAFHPEVPPVFSLLTVYFGLRAEDIIMMLHKSPLGENSKNTKKLALPSFHLTSLLPANHCSTAHGTHQNKKTKQAYCWS